MTTDEGATKTGMRASQGGKNECASFAAVCACVCVAVAARVEVEVGPGQVEVDVMSLLGCGGQDSNSLSSLRQALYSPLNN